MANEKKAGIWLDHSSAHIIDYPSEGSAMRTLNSDFTQTAKKESLEKSEHVMHNKEQHQMSEYYNELGKIILDYDSVLLFGPTNAKLELANHLKADHKYEKIKIKTMSSDKLNEHQEIAFVNEFFLQPINL